MVQAENRTVCVSDISGLCTPDMGLIFNRKIENFKCVICDFSANSRGLLIAHYDKEHKANYIGKGKDKKLLIQFPTRKRKDKFFDVLDIYYNLLDDLDKTKFHIVIDEDDIEMNSEPIKSKLNSYKNLSFSIGNHNSKISAINDLGTESDFDIILLASDDMIPQIKGYDSIIRDRMFEYFNDDDGVLWFFDGFRKDLNTLCILGKKYYNRFNYIYNPEYKSVYCDDEFTQVADILNKQVYFEDCIIKHEHLIWTGKPKDETAIRDDSLYETDKQTFNRRKNNNFFFAKKK